MSIQCQQQSHLERLFGADPMCAVLGERKILPRLDGVFPALEAVQPSTGAFSAAIEKT